jgi:hypothetical protein
MRYGPVLNGGRAAGCVRPGSWWSAHTVSDTAATRRLKKNLRVENGKIKKETEEKRKSLRSNLELWETKIQN